MCEGGEGPAGLVGPSSLRRKSMRVSGAAFVAGTGEGGGGAAADGSISNSTSENRLSVENLAEALVEMSTNPLKRQGVHHISELLSLPEFFQSCVRDIQEAEETARYTTAYRIASALLPVKMAMDRLMMTMHSAPPPSSSSSS